MTGLQLSNANPALATYLLVAEGDFLALDATGLLHERARNESYQTVLLESSEFRHCWPKIR